MPYRTENLTIRQGNSGKTIIPLYNCDLTDMKKLRLLGYYYCSSNQKNRLESDKIEDANNLALLLEKTVQDLLQNPNTDSEIKEAIGVSVLVFKDENNNLCEYIAKDKTAKITGVKFKRNDILQVPLKYKAWFFPGHHINLIQEKEEMRITTASKEGEAISRPARPVEEADVVKVKTRLRLENNYFIGQFSPERAEGWYKISDIRNSDFTKIEDKERGVKDLTISFRSQNKEFNRFAYYKFTWVLLGTSPLKFGIDLREEVIPIYPKDIVQCLHDSIVHYPASAAKKITRTLDTLNKQLTQSGKEVFIYELLQNANDYPRKQKDSSSPVPVPVPVDVEFHITDEYLTFQHTGDYFNPKNIAAICDINDGEKSDNVEAIGYKGIGFKTVFLDNDYVYLNTGNYSFRFDISATDIINTPWQILPVWTEPTEISPTIQHIFDHHANDAFRVKFALKPRDRRILTDRGRKDNYIDLFTSVFETERVILFIPNIRKVSVFWGNTTVPAVVREKNSNDWCVSKAMTDDVPEFVRERINDVLTNQDADKSDGYEKIPEKYLNFYKTAVKFACRRIGRKLLPVDDAILYCYLPAKRADWGFNFLMNTDMVPNGARDDIEDIELNHEIAKIAGRQFFFWIKELLTCGDYELDSVFSLIPDFNFCKETRKQYASFIEEFQNEFETLIKKVPFVPVVDKKGNKTYSCIDTIINDKTGITEKNVMSDADFISLMGKTDFRLPVPELRKSEAFLTLLKRYSPQEMDIEYGTIADRSENEDFQVWLKNIDNNIRLINHFIEIGDDELTRFSRKKVFIENNGELCRANDLYYDFDKDADEIRFLKPFVPHLCDRTRNCFMDEPQWTKFVSLFFRPFDAKSIICNYVIDNVDVIELLKKQKNSIAFYRFAAHKSVSLLDVKNKIPYIVEDGVAITDYEGCLYFFNPDSYQTSKEVWLGKNKLNILSHLYLEDEKDVMTSYFRTLGFKEFSKGNFVSTILAKDIDFKRFVNECIDDDFERNAAFVKYAFSCRESIDENCVAPFKDYVLSCMDIDGNEVYLCNDDLRYFNQESYAGNTTFEENKSHVWLTSEMMYCLNSKYFDNYNDSEIKNLESFFRQQFGIKTFTDKTFFTEVVLKNKKEIYESLTDKDKMLEFVGYLKRDMNHIFDGTINFNEFKDMPLLCADGTIIKERQANVKLIENNEDAIILYKKNWCPDVFAVMSDEYSKGFSKEIPQRYFDIIAFDLNEILSDILKNHYFKEALKDVSNNTDFWRWIKENTKKLNDFELLKELCLLDKNNNCCICSSLYISDFYQNDGIEGLVRKYEPNASFISDSYLEESGANKNEWLKLFKKLGLKSDNKDILLNSVLPNLSSFEEDSVVTMMSKHLKDLKEVWDDRKDEIVKLRVRTKSGEYKRLDETILIDIQEETVAEPFKYIELSNEVATDILENNKELLKLISEACSNHRTISNKQEWAEEKIYEYINNIQCNEEKRSSIHIDFVRELAKLSTEYDFSSGMLDAIQYLVKGQDAVYKTSDEITLGNAYKPNCDFESNGVAELCYLSEDYIFEGNRDIIKSFFKSRGMHQTMSEDDLQYLSIRAFACYFWSYCFVKSLSDYEDWIYRGLFDEVVCIPTEKSVKAPRDLYFTRMWVYAKETPGWEEKVPCKSVIDKIESAEARNVFDKLPFNPTLSFKECLYYLLNAQDRSDEETSRRKEICNWILQSNEINTDLVNIYRRDQKALWRNCKWQKKHISDLYAIHPNAKQQREIFRGNEHVLLSNMFPSNVEEFERLCSILGITCLTADDFVSTPINKVDETEKMMRAIKPRILVLATIEDSDKYKEKYEKYDEIISAFRFYVCDQIDLGHDTLHNDVERIYDEDKHIYYVGSWQHSRTFTRFCSKIKNILGINVSDNVFEDVFDESRTVEQSIEKYCSAFLYDESFRSYLENLDCSVPDVVEDEPEIEEDYYSEVTNSSSVFDESGDSFNEESIDNTVSETETREGVLIEDDNEEDDDGTVMTSSGTAQEQDSLSQVPQQRNTDEKQYESTRLSGTTEKVQKPLASAPLLSQEDESLEPEVDSHVQENERQVARTEEDCKTEVSNESEEIDNKPIEEECGGSVEEHDDYIGSVSKDKNYDPIGIVPHKPFVRRAPKPFTNEELDRLRSNGTPLELESLPATKEEMDALGQMGISPEQIADTNYLAQLRLYQNLRQRGDYPEESIEEFVKNADDVSIHKLRSGKYIHSCSAARGVMYVSPSIWNKMLDDKCAICVYLNGQGKNFHYINSPEEFLHLVEKDDVVIKITGKEKVNVVKTMYSGLLNSVKGTVYTLIRVASHTNMDAVFAHYVGAMAEPEDGNDYNEY